MVNRKRGKKYSKKIRGGMFRSNAPPPLHIPLGNNDNIDNIPPTPGFGAAASSHPMFGNVSPIDNAPPPTAYRPMSPRSPPFWTTLNAMASPSFAMAPGTPSMFGNFSPPPTVGLYPHLPREGRFVGPPFVWTPSPPSRQQPNNPFMMPPSPPGPNGMPPPVSPVVPPTALATAYERVMIPVAPWPPSPPIYHPDGRRWDGDQERYVRDPLGINRQASRENWHNQTAKRQKRGGHRKKTRKY